MTIPCYADTDKRIPDENINIQWEKDGKPFVMLQHRKMSYGPGFEGHGFITASQYKNGDLSLTIPKVQQSDGGIYRCRHRHEEPGQPEAVDLRISGECFIRQRKKRRENALASLKSRRAGEHAALH